VLTCFPADERIDLIALGNELGGIAVEANHDELPEGLRGMHGPCSAAAGLRAPRGGRR
jgi:hypothetical protein